MARLDTYKNIFPHAKLTRSPDGVLDVVLHTNWETPTRNSWISRLTISLTTPSAFTSPG
jgi:hypothetical protein